MLEEAEATADMWSGEVLSDQLKPGDKVMLRNMARNSRFEPMATGPFTVAEVRKNTATLKEVSGDYVNAEQLVRLG